MKGVAEQLGQRFVVTHLPGCDDPRCEACGTDVPLPRTCHSCARGNLAVHSFCGHCGTRLPTHDPTNTTSVTFNPSEEITLVSGSSMPVNSEQITLVSDNPATDPCGRPATELLDTTSDAITGAQVRHALSDTTELAIQIGPVHDDASPVPRLDVSFAEYEEGTGETDTRNLEPRDADASVRQTVNDLTEQVTPAGVPAATSFEFTQRVPIENQGKSTGLCVVLLGETAVGVPIDAYPLEYGEPLDVDGPELSHPATFTATPHGLRLDSLGGLKGVYQRLEPRSRRIQWRRLRTERELGTFQALAPGEYIPAGSLALIDDVLIRVDAV